MKCPHCNTPQCNCNTGEQTCFAASAPHVILKKYAQHTFQECTRSEVGLVPDHNSCCAPGLCPDIICFNLTSNIIV